MREVDVKNPLTCKHSAMYIQVHFFHDPYIALTFGLVSHII